ncbi:putative hydrolase of the HAD superfamily [Anaeroplasma bactoclasticum]|jgi:putative hydrolase of the HAD superfamily|uniref:Putative hydrolase of the HAD superfamily n=1 Tax=Anaeroplasma bactoclasticum TaxID=2088 RepID=A0A397RZY1_9MOLU|nr:HAD family hydrolase [Anaeroplasma bactoclasticum]RIA77989.1 putative hydrolase of the HAD superfamily [Anaeroplasma bactoclasticum]
MKTVIFDLYGTLMNIHTDEERDSFWKNLAKAFKDYKEYEPMELKSEYLKLCKELEKEKEEIEILDVFHILYPEGDVNKIAITFRKLSTDFIHPYFGVKRLLKKLKSEGYKIYLLSNAQASFTKWELSKFNLEYLFDGIFLSSDLGIKKPNMAYYNALIEKYSIDTNNAIMIGNDYNNDILPAKELGLKTIYIESNQSYFVDTEDKIINFSYRKVLNRIHELL